MIALALLVASAALAAGLAATLLLRLLPTVRLQLAGLALLAATVPLAAVLLSGWVMFHMGADVKILTVTTVAALRTQRGLSQRAISSPGVSYAYISRIEAGARAPSMKALRHSQRSSASASSTSRPARHHRSSRGWPRRGSTSDR